MRDLIQLEAWVSDIVDRVKRGIAIEDDRIEFKREWPRDFYKAARWIAGLANAARGGEVLWLVGVDPKQDPYFFDPGPIDPQIGSRKCLGNLLISIPLPTECFRYTGQGVLR
jgi:hypothetical protein